MDDVVEGIFDKDFGISDGDEGRAIARSSQLVRPGLTLSTM